MKAANPTPKKSRKQVPSENVDYPKMNLKSLRKVTKVKGGFDQSLMELGLTLEPKSKN